MFNPIQRNRKQIVSEKFEKAPGCYYLQFMPEFHAAHLWRFVIDGNRQDTGPLTFDVGNKGEPGYLVEMMKGLDYIAATLHQPLTCNFIEQLHDECIKNVKINIEAHNQKFDQLRSTENQAEVINIDPPKPVPMLNIRNNIPVNFGLLCVYPCDSPLKEVLENKANITKNGLLEVLDYINSTNEQYGNILSLTRVARSLDEQDETIDIKNFDFEQLQDLISNENKIVLRSEGVDNNLLKKIMSDLILDYQSKIEKAKDDTDKIKIIAKFIQKLEILHPFTDANCRTFCILLLNKLLLENKLTPAIMDNPNRFDGFANQELAEEIIEGQEKFLSFNNYHRCDELSKEVMQLKPFKKAALNTLFSQYTNSLTPLERLNLIEHVYVKLEKSKSNNYLSLLQNMYEGELEKLSNIHTNVELRKIKSELNIHYLSQSFQDQIKNLKPASSNKEVSIRENSRKEIDQNHAQQSLIEKKPALQTICKAFKDKLRTLRDIKDDQVNPTPSNRF